MSRDRVRPRGRAGARRPGGLRLRLVVALVLTSLVALLAAILTILPPLDHRIDRDRVAAVRALARTAIGGLRSAEPEQLRRGSPAARILVGELGRRAGGRVALYDARGRSLASSDDDRRGPPRRAGDPAGGPDRDDGPGAAARRADRSLARSGTLRPGRITTATDARGIVVRGAARLADGSVVLLVLRKPLGDSRAAADVVRRSLPLAAAVALAAALLVALATSTGLLRRLGRLRDDARALGDDGLDHPVRVGPADEVGEVAAALEAMRARLVTEERERQAFLATASHELRTPLAGLLGTLELLDEELRDGDAGTRRRTAVALERTRRLVALSGELLDLGRLDAGEALVPEPLDVTAVAREAASESRDALAAAGRELAVEAPGPVPAQADGTAVARVLANLLENARRYGGGTVLLSVAPRPGGGATIRVRDEGPGIPETERDLVFRRFERGSSAGHPGFGLGLAIARDLARGMGGDLVVEEGPGATFALTLPAAEG